MSDRTLDLANALIQAVCDREPDDPENIDTVCINVRSLSLTVEQVADPLYAELDALRAERDRLRAALERLRDCDWVISLPDRMDAVRDIARAALKA